MEHLKILKVNVGNLFEITSFSGGETHHFKVPIL